VYILAWISALDGDVDQRELEFINSTRLSSQDVTMDALLGRISNRSPQDPATALEILDTTLNPEMKEKFLELSIVMAISDGRIRQSELHAIRLIADLFNYLPKALDNVFRRVAGRPMPIPGDPSSRFWWENRRPEGGGTEEERQEKREREKEATRNDQDRARKAWARAVLGVGEDATQSEIKAAFRHLSHTTHPDRFSSLGQEGVEAAGVLFRKVHEAYEVLREDA